MEKSLLDVAHKIAADLHKAGAIDAQTMHKFDAKCLPPVRKYNPEQIKQIRLSNKASQAVFAAYLNTSPSTIRQWKQGLKKPSQVLVSNHEPVYY